MDTADRIITALDAQGLLTDAGRARPVVDAALAGQPAAPRGALREVLAYVGGALVLGAGMRFAAEEFSSLSTAGQVALTWGTAVLLAVGGVLSGTAGDARRRLAGALFSAAAVLAGCGAGIWVDHLHRGYDSWPFVVGAAVTAAVALLGWLRAPTAAGQVAMLGPALASAGTLVGDHVHHHESAWVGLVLVGLAALWLVAFEARRPAGLEVARALGLVALLLGAQFPLFDDSEPLAYALTGALAVVGVLRYLATHSWSYLAVAILAVTLVVPEAAHDWFGNSLGTSGAILLAGLTLLGASLAGWRLRDEVR